MLERCTTFFLTCRPMLRTASSRAFCGAPPRTPVPILVAACLLLAGCGSSCPVATVKGCLTKAEYETELASTVEDIRSSPGLEGRWGLEAINVAEAWAHLRVVRGTEQPGLGVTVGVIDTGIDLSHPTFQEGAAAGKVTEEFLLGAVDETGVELSHGTGVASIIAGRVNPMYTYPFTGIAPYATLKMFAIPLGDPPPPDVPIAPVELSALAMYDEDDADLYRDMLFRRIWTS